MSTQAQSQLNDSSKSSVNPTTAAIPAVQTSTAAINTPSSNVRHIPIHVEGRDEPIVNQINDDPKSTFAFNQSNDGHIKMGSLFDRVKNFPTRTMRSSSTSSSQRNQSPNRSVPIYVQHEKKINNDSSGIRLNSVKPGQENCPIFKIQKIQKEVLELMDNVEKFNGTSRQEKQYLYLDEMLTQNLLKLDNIDADGQENIKQARKEAINCINKCIAVLEAKVDGTSQANQENTMPTSVNQAASIVENITNNQQHPNLNDCQSGRIQGQK